MSDNDKAPEERIRNNERHHIAYLLEQHGDTLSIEDAEFVAAARELVPELVAEVEKLRSELEHLRGLQRDDRATAQAAIDERDKLRAEAEKAIQLLTDLTDPDDCWFDHRGGCQAHGFFHLKRGEICPNRLARDLTCEKGAGDGQ